jgi:hypothetical protein
MEPIEPGGPSEPDFELLGLTEVEQAIIRAALWKEITKEPLTIVEDVMLKEYRMKLQAREAERELKRAIERKTSRNSENGGPV